MTDEPSLGEVNRRLAAIEGRLEEALRTSVGRELYASQREADRADVKALEVRMDKQEAQQQANRRLLVTAFVAPILVAVILLYVSAQIGAGR